MEAYFLPGAEKAVVAPDKITSYLFDTTRTHGWAKGRFFERFGFNRESPLELRHALLDHVRRNPAVFNRATPYGDRWMIVGPIVSPDGRNPVIGTIWQYDLGTDYPRFITVELGEGEP